jgi:phosphoglucomutase
MGRDPGALYLDLANEFRNPINDRVQVPATPKQRKRLTALSRQDVTVTEFAGEKIDSIINRAPGDGAAIGGIKGSSASGWFAARPSGTEDIYKIYAESFRGADQLQQILKEAQATVDAVIAPA